MKTIFLIFVLLLLPVHVFGGTKLLVEFDGDTHRLVNVFTENKQDKLQPVINNKVDNSRFQIRWKTLDSKQLKVMNMQDPRVMRAPLTNGENPHHEAIILRQKGAYIIEISEEYLPEELMINIPGKSNELKASQLIKLPINIEVK